MRAEGSKDDKPGNEAKSLCAREASNFWGLEENSLIIVYYYALRFIISEHSHSSAGSVSAAEPRLLRGNAARLGYVPEIRCLAIALQ